MALLSRFRPSTTLKCQLIWRTCGELILWDLTQACEGEMLFSLWLPRPCFLKVLFHGGSDLARIRHSNYLFNQANYKSIPMWEGGVNSMIYWTEYFSNKYFTSFSFLLCFFLENTLSSKGNKAFCTREHYKDTASKNKSQWCGIFETLL